MANDVACVYNGHVVVNVAIVAWWVFLTNLLDTVRNRLSNRCRFDFFYYWHYFKTVKCCQSLFDSVYSSDQLYCNERVLISLIHWLGDLSLFVFALNHFYHLCKI